MTPGMNASKRRTSAQPDDEYFLDFLKACRKFRDKLQNIIEHYEKLSLEPESNLKFQRTKKAAESMIHAIEDKILKGKSY